MKRSYRILPVYTGDVSGVCSALYELGGMVVIHDPSGCNSTYNTHDEIRWYDQESLIFISGLKERDAILGNDEKFIEDILMAAKQLHPRFITLVNSPIPYLNGTDFKGICRILEKQLSLDCTYVKTNGMHDYTVGASRAMEMVATQFVKKGNTREKTVNILGMTPLDYTHTKSVSSLKKRIEAHGWHVQSCWLMDCSLEEIATAGQASCNLVISSSGLQAAEVLWRSCGIPYVLGVPVGACEDLVFEKMEQAVHDHENQTMYKNLIQTNAKTTVIGEPVLAHSIAMDWFLTYRQPVKVICTTEKDHRACLKETCIALDEETMEQALHYDTVIGDPMFQYISKNHKKWVKVPHFALSGRLYLNDMINYWGKDGLKWD